MYTVTVTYAARQYPHKNVFQRLEHLIQETGWVDGSADIPGRPCTVRTPQAEEAVVGTVENNPNASIQGIGGNLNISYGTVPRILRGERYYPVHYTKEEDFPLSVNFCLWMFERMKELWAGDSGGFKVNGAVSRRLKGYTGAKA